MASTESDQLHIVFCPLMAYSHMLPMLDAARLFAARGVRATIITTPRNAPIFTRSIQRNQDDNDTVAGINVQIIKFPSKEVGLPEGVEEGSTASTEKETFWRFLTAVRMLEEPIEQAIYELRPNALIVDLAFTWNAKWGAKYGIPSLIFSSSSLFSYCCQESALLYQPHTKVSKETELFTLPGLPGTLEFNKLQLPDYIGSEGESGMKTWFLDVIDSMKTSYGKIVNSFYELEQGYVDYYRKVLGRKLWHIGPVSLCNKSLEEKAQRGNINTAPVTEEYNCMKWLDSKKPESVVYASFGTTTKFSDEQLREIATGLEASGQDFIWVVSRGKKDEDYGEEEKWLPNGFEERMVGKGLIIRRWAPQVLILGHEAIGGFVTHCGWNSITEGVAAGIPMATWPNGSEQFFNEKLVTDVLRIGVGLGVQRCGGPWDVDHVKSETIKKAVMEIMVGEMSDEMRSRAKKLGEMAKRAVEQGGSSCNDLEALIEELKSYHRSRA